MIAGCHVRNERLVREVCANVHRDIKPAHIMVTAHGAPKLLDFGIAKLLSPDALDQTVPLTRPAEGLMTPDTRVRNGFGRADHDLATDVYTMGVLLYELVSGKRPFRAENLSPATLERLICDAILHRPSLAGLSTAEGTQRKSARISITSS